MATAAVTNTFVSGQDALASEVNQNFDDLVTFANSSVVHRDGTKAFTGNVDFGANKATNLATPTASTDGVTKGYVDSYLPKGMITPYAGASAPSGWLLCDGSAVSRTTYADLFAVVGTTYGSGDGSTTFNLPDLRSKFVAGKGAAGWSDALAETGGSADAINVAHTHTYSGTTASDSHTHSVDPPDTSLNTGARDIRYWEGRTADVGGATFLVWQTSGATGVLDFKVNVSSFTSGSDTHSHTYSGTTASSGSSGTDANLPPYVTLNHIIKV